MAGMFAPKAQSSKETRLNAIEVNQSAYGNAIALTYGKTRVPMTLWWYGAFTATAHANQQAGGKGGGGKSTNTTFTYSAAVVMGLGEGQIQGIGTVWADKAQTTLADLGLTLFDGAGGQSPWSYLTTNFPAEAIPYDHSAYVANGSFQLGSSAALPNLTFEVKGLLSFNPGTIDDAEPSDIITDYCTDANHGAGFDFLGTLQGAGVDTYESYCISMGLFISPSERQQRPAAEFLREILTITNSDCYWSAAGLLEIKPLADANVSGNGRTYAPGLTPFYSFNDDDYLYDEGEDPVRLTRKPPEERFNVVRVEFLNRAHEYNTDIAEAKDDTDIALNGERVMPTVTLHAIQDKAVARRAAQLIMQRGLYVVNSYTWKVRADYCLLETMDMVAITDTGMGISNKLLRLTDVQDDEEDELTLTGEEVLVGTAGAPAYNWQAAQGYAANYNASPGSVSAPLIFAAPPLLVDTNGGYEIWIAVSGAGAMWGGCDVFMSLDNSSYGFIGTIAGPARHGTLTATLATGTDPDTTHTLAVQLARTDLQLVSGAAADYNENRTLLYVDGEIMAYQTATLTGAGAYNITNLRRGQYGSAPASHASASKFARIDGAIFRVPIDPGMIGQTAYFKFCSFNVYGGAYEQLGSMVAYSKVLALANGGQLSPGPLMLTATGNCVSAGDRAFRSSGTPAWDSQVYSQQGYRNGAYVSFRPAQATADLMVGLNTDPATNANYTSIDYAFYVSSAGNLYAYYENGTAAASVGTYVPGDDLSLIYDGTIVRYLKNSLVLYETMAGPGLALYLDSSFYTPGGAVTDIRFGPYGAAVPVMFAARGYCTVSDTNAMKVGGVTNWDSGIYSLKGYEDCHLSFKPNDTTSGFMVGFSEAPLLDQSYTSIDHALFCNNGTLQICELGSLIGSYGSYTTATQLAITYDGTSVRYYKDGSLLRTVGNVGETFYLDSSFADPGAGINSLRFGPTTNLAVADTSQIGLNAAFKTYSNTGAAGGAITGSFASPSIIGSITVPAQLFGSTVVVTLVSNMNTTAGSAGGAGTWAYIDTVSNPFYDATVGNSRVYQPTAGLSSVNNVSIEETFSLAAGVSATYNVYGVQSGGGTGRSGGIAGWRLKAEVMFR